MPCHILFIIFCRLKILCPSVLINGVMFMPQQTQMVYSY
ncbi:hypothetical protein MGSAQ_003400 [marine sediment metagenome]|uniref:Uncharacterized protein n=1 Tax=marine sediment metagenome TaxID=412755 RepID=A0A1B6NP19_9ZZZZ